MLEALKVPAPVVIGVAEVKFRVGVFAPCVKFPVKVIFEIVTVPELLFERVNEVFGITVPKVIFPDPARACVALKVAAPVPLLNVVPFINMPPPKNVAGLVVERSQTPPELIETPPVNVLLPVAAVIVLRVPEMDELPVTVNAYPAKDKVVPDPTERLPTVKVATVVAVAVPLRVKLPATDIPLVNVFAPEPERVRLP